jgi:hypothetical protein
LWDRIITIGKSVLGETLDGINRQRHKILLKWEGIPQSMQLHMLWHGPNGLMAIFLAITVVRAILERWANGRDASNGHIASPWQSANIFCSNISMKFHFCKPSFFEVLPGTSYNFSNFSLFLLRFLALFPEI